MYCDRCSDDIRNDKRIQYNRDYYEKVKIKNKQKIVKTLDFTSFLALFHKILVFLLMVYNAILPKYYKNDH